MKKKTSKKYKKLEESSKISLVKLYGKMKNFQEVEIIRFVKGSIVIHYKIVFKV